VSVLATTGTTAENAHVSMSRTRSETLTNMDVLNTRARFKTIAGS
jgi:hypothetical protein